GRCDETAALQALRDLALPARSVLSEMPLSRTRMDPCFGRGEDRLLGGVPPSLSAGLSTALQRDRGAARGRADADQQSRRRDAGGWLYRTHGAAGLCYDARPRDAAALALRRRNCAGAQNTQRYQRERRLTACPCR